MKRPLFSHRLTAMLTAFFALAFTASMAAAQSAGQLEGELSSLSGQMSSAESNASTADQVISRLDNAEGTFAKLTSSGKVDKGALIPIFHQLESMLDRMQAAYSKKKDDCIAQIDSGGQCDYDQPEQLALRAAYPLAWLRFTAATTLFDDNAEQSKKLLNQSIDGFTASMLAMPDPNLIRENTLGRAYCERELGKFDRNEYNNAINDFKKIMDDGSGTQQYAAARQGLSTTYAKMGNAEEAAKTLPTEPGGHAGSGQFMLQLQTLFSAERATSDPAKKAAYHKQIIDLMKSKENDKEGWAVDVAAASKFPTNAVEEFGNSNDPFEKWLLAAVLLSRKDEANAAKYYAEAGASGKYPKAYKFAADIYLREKRYDLVEAMLSKIAAGGGGDAQWAEYLKFSLAHNRWEQSGQKDTALEDQWVKDAQDYLQKDPNGEHAAEMRVQLADRLQRQGKFVEAAQMYSQVKGDPEFTFTAKFKAAECYYKQLLGASAKDNKGPKVDTEQLKKAALDNLNESIKMGAEAERSASTPAAKKAVREIRGEATYMLASILEEDPDHVDYAQVAPLLVGYESNYPMMSAKFPDVVEWRITALDHLGKYDEVNTDVAALVERSHGDVAKGDFIKGLGIDFWKTALAAKDNNDEKSYHANAKLTATAYKFFADMAASGKIPVKNLTGTLSIYAQALQANGQDDEADKIFEQVVKADPASPDANAGLARRAQSKKDWKDAVNLWTAVENTAAESDPLWYEAKYQLAVVYNEQGNTQGACSKLAQTRAEHPTLGSEDMKVRWDKLQRSLCLDHQR
ncbi:MAG TPA: tetratricopeptide repeat protein [Candidatus Binatus sp.]|uniref:tetratricopeptide repeat protein n=1 Tax=Candidatus Binatus sp. TaxID=2811406 RepID=UPI002B4A591D|nr:tetratricopeptide repeat protein [Candidatus Binatus sp.]HKN13035.1 tetratricopeptide repeat protein [Candidatus Binatus sp.]